MNRVDLFTVIHKGIRALLFDLSREAARVDLTSTHAVDGLVAMVERTLAFLDEHAHIEESMIDDAIAAELAEDHRALEVVQLEVQRAADALALAELSARAEQGAHLARVINHLVAVQLVHMNREETEINAKLWANFSDADLIAIRNRVKDSQTPERHAEWMQIVGPALNPVERRLVIG